MIQGKKLDFSDTTIYCGVDVHKKSWRVNIQDSDFELEDFTQNPDAVLLHKHLTNRYPGATYKIGYEAGFSGCDSCHSNKFQGLQLRNNDMQNDFIKVFAPAH